ncbi:MAG: DUF3107 domain-containing protein [Acidimicrobiales bacterium]|nr:DUF3107 domain-containing protein [Acidimicrobiales bacterium]MCB1015030.1 DUF3107 domain-containing protein [Acidimicrobiales bacterium]MCB9373065.1 DUF3107 domain-containing protein [Microthrixaceae bacterium]
MDVRIGVTYSPKELDLDLGDGVDRDALHKEIEAAIASDGVLWLTDKRGRQVGVPASKVAYVEIGSPDDERRIGFGAG